MTIDPASLQSRDGARRVFAGPGSGGAYSIVACLTRMTIDHASLARRSTSDDLGVSGIKADKWIIAAQDANEWYKRVKKGQREPGLYFSCALVCPNVTDRTKERIAQSNRGRDDLLATID